MINNEQLWEIGQTVLRSLGSHYEGGMDSAAKNFGLKSPIWYPLTAAYIFKPDPISVQRLKVRSPYSSTSYFGTPLQALTEAGFLVQSPLGGYSITDQGNEATLAILFAAYKTLEAISLLSKDKMRSLANSLGRLVQACMIHGYPISKWSIIYSRRLDESSTENYAAKIDQYLSDLFSYRDDSHLASWRNLAVSGHAWDVLSVIWREGPISIEVVSDRLARRKWTKEETHQAVDEIRTNGWIEETMELTVTERGNHIRNEAEALTNDYFFSPWDSAPRSDLETLSTLLPELNELLGVD